MKRVFVLAGLLIGLLGCHNTDEHERYRLSSRLMQLGLEAGEAHFREKSGFSREGSVGGIGNSAGGGCGCY